MYCRDPRTDKAATLVAEVAKLGPGIFRRDKKGYIIQETGDFLVQVDPETEWWWVGADERE